jgi:hypothetical protein
MQLVGFVGNSSSYFSLSIHMVHLRLFPWSSRSKALLMSFRSTSCVMNLSSSNSCICKRSQKILLPGGGSKPNKSCKRNSGNAILSDTEANLVQVLIGKNWNALLWFHPSEKRPHDTFAVENLQGRYGERSTVHFHSKNDRLPPTLPRQRMDVAKCFQNTLLLVVPPPPQVCVLTSREL